MDVFKSLSNLEYPQIKEFLTFQIREKYGIEGSLINDLIAICCCPLCALIQSSRQVTYIQLLVISTPQDLSPT